MIPRLLEIKKVSRLTLLQFGFLTALLLMLPKFISIPFYLKLCTAFCIVILIFFSKNHKYLQPLWLYVILIVGFEIFRNYFLAANHIFVLFYLGILILMGRIYYYNSSRIIDYNTKMILFLLLFFGGLQKLISTPFLHGDLMHFMFLKGQIAAPLLQMDVFQNYFTENNKAIEQFAQTYTSTSEFISLKPLLNNQYWFFYVFSIFVIIIEFVLAAMVWVKNEKLKFVFFSFFLVGLLLTRIETGFASLLCLMLALQLPSIEKNYKLFYLALFCICSILIAFGVGLH